MFDFGSAQTAGACRNEPIAPNFEDKKEAAVSNDQSSMFLKDS